jgi:hypothetical protein
MIADAQNPVLAYQGSDGVVFETGVVALRVR